MNTIFVDAVSSTPELTAVPPAIAAVEVEEVATEEGTLESLKIPSDIFLHYDEEEVVKKIDAKFNMLKLFSFIKNVKEVSNPLHFNLRKQSKVFIFGGGGTTSWFLPKLLKIYNDAFNKVPSLAYDLEIVVIDADIVESKNIIRQNFISEDVGFNKAQVLADRYSELYDKIKVTFVDKYATYGKFDSRFLAHKTYDPNFFVDIADLNIRRKDIVINLVDNEGFKKKLDFYLANRRCLFFAAGVNLFNGQSYFTNNVKTNSYVWDHPDLLDIFDEVSVHACADADANGTDDNPEQLFNGNDIAASLLANTYQTALTDIPLNKRTNFVTGANINVSTTLKTYSSLFEHVEHVLLNGSSSGVPFSASATYCNKHGMGMTTPAALKHYKNLEFYKDLKLFHDLYINRSGESTSEDKSVDILDATITASQSDELVYTSFARETP